MKNKKNNTTLYLLALSAFCFVFVIAQTGMLKPSKNKTIKTTTAIDPIIFLETDENPAEASADEAPFEKVADEVPFEEVTEEEVANNKVAEGIDWSQAPGVGTQERQAFYDKHNLAYDSSIAGYDDGGNVIAVDTQKNTINQNSVATDTDTQNPQNSAKKTEVKTAELNSK